MSLRMWTVLENFVESLHVLDGLIYKATRPKQPSMAATARVIWLCACVRYWPDRGLVFECVTSFYCRFDL